MDDHNATPANDAIAIGESRMGCPNLWLSPWQPPTAAFAEEHRRPRRDGGDPSDHAVVEWTLDASQRSCWREEKENY